MDDKPSPCQIICGVVLLLILLVLYPFLDMLRPESNDWGPWRENIRENVMPQVTAMAFLVAVALLTEWIIPASLR